MRLAYCALLSALVFLFFNTASIHAETVRIEPGLYEFTLKMSSPEGDSTTCCTSLLRIGGDAKTPTLSIIEMPANARNLYADSLPYAPISVSIGSDQAIVCKTTDKQHRNPILQGYASIVSQAFAPILRAIASGQIGALKGQAVETKGDLEIIRTGADGLWSLSRQDHALVSYEYVQKSVVIDYLVEKVVFNALVLVRRRESVPAFASWKGLLGSRFKDDRAFMRLWNDWDSPGYQKAVEEVFDPNGNNSETLRNCLLLLDPAAMPVPLQNAARDKAAKYPTRDGIAFLAKFGALGHDVIGTLVHLRQMRKKLVDSTLAALLPSLAGSVNALELFQFFKNYAEGFDLFDRLLKLKWPPRCEAVLLAGVLKQEDLPSVRRAAFITRAHELFAALGKSANKEDAHDPDEVALNEVYCALVCAHASTLEMAMARLDAPSSLSRYSAYYFLSQRPEELNAALVIRMAKDPDASVQMLAISIATEKKLAIDAVFELLKDDTSYLEQLSDEIGDISPYPQIVKFMRAALQAPDKELVGIALAALVRSEEITGQDLAGIDFATLKPQAIFDLRMVGNILIDAKLNEYILRKNAKFEVQEEVISADINARRYVPLERLAILRQPDLSPKQALKLLDLLSNYNRDPRVPFIAEWIKIAQKPETRKIPAEFLAKYHFKIRAEALLVAESLADSDAEIRSIVWDLMRREIEPSIDFDPDADPAKTAAAREEIKQWITTHLPVERPRPAERR